MRKLTTDEIIASCKQRHYSYEQNETTLAKFRAAGTEEIIVCVGGYRIVATVYGTTLVQLKPKATSAGRGEFTLWTGERRDSWIVKICDRFYYQDKMGSKRVLEALALAAIAWETAARHGGGTDNFYKALGSRGFCACCGATLTDPLSQSRGIGPECAKRIYKTRAVRILQERNMTAATR